MAVDSEIKVRNTACRANNCPLGIPLGVQLGILTDLPTRLGPDISTIPTPSHWPSMESRRGSSHPLNDPNGDLPFPFPFPSSYASLPSTQRGAVSRIHSSTRSSRSSSSISGSKLMIVGRGVYMRFSVVLIPPDSGVSAD